MPKTTVILLPSLQRRLAGVGENLHLARLRRKISATQLAERAGITRPTLQAIERGDPSVSFGAYASVLFCLGLDQDMEALARDDELGRKLQDARLTVMRRAPRRPQGDSVGGKPVYRIQAGAYHDEKSPKEAQSELKANGPSPKTEV